MDGDNSKVPARSFLAVEPFELFFRILVFDEHISGAAF